jgi:hypothetical protein
MTCGRSEVQEMVNRRSDDRYTYLLVSYASIRLTCVYTSPLIFDYTSDCFPFSDQAAAKR